ncbi:hypothetical protein AAMO2058_001448600 [Amorphochlora amoebiformis]
MGTTYMRSTHLESIQRCVSSLLQRILHSLRVVPYGIRYLACLIKQLDERKIERRSESQPTSPGGLFPEFSGYPDDLFSLEGEVRKRKTESSPFASLRTFFWDWIIDGILCPGPHQLCRWRPLSTSAVASLNIVASVVVKLAIAKPEAARFGKISPQSIFNEYIRSMRPRIHAFTASLESSSGEPNPFETSTPRGTEMQPVEPLVFSLQSLRVIDSVFSRLVTTKRPESNIGAQTSEAKIGAQPTKEKGGPEAKTGIHPEAKTGIHPEAKIGSPKLTLDAEKYKTFSILVTDCRLPPPITPAFVAPPPSPSSPVNRGVSVSGRRGGENEERTAGEESCFVVLDSGIASPEPPSFPRNYFDTPPSPPPPCHRTRARSLPTAGLPDRRNKTEDFSNSASISAARNLKAWGEDMLGILNRLASAISNSLGIVGEVSPRPPPGPQASTLTNIKCTDGIYRGELAHNLRGEGQRHLRLGRPDLSTLLAELANLLESTDSVRLLGHLSPPGESLISLASVDGKSNSVRVPNKTLGYLNLIKLVLKQQRIRVETLRQSQIEVKAAHTHSLIATYRSSLSHWKSALLEAVLDVRVQTILEPIASKLAALRTYALQASASLLHMQPSPRLLIRGHTGPQNSLMGYYRLVKTPSSKRRRGKEDDKNKESQREPPMYRHEKDPSLYLYYYKPYGLWLVGSVPGRHHGWLFVNCKFRLPTMIPEYSKWTYWNKESSRWMIDTKITVQPIDTVINKTEREKQLDVLHRIEDLFTIIPTPKAKKTSSSLKHKSPRNSRSPTHAPSLKSRAQSTTIPANLLNLQEEEEEEGSRDACKGKWPASLEEDYFLCERCTAILKRHKQMVHRFMNRYASHSPPFTDQSHEAKVCAAALTSERVAPRGTRVSVRVADYVIGTIYPSILVPCTRANKRFSSLMNRLAKRFPTFESLYTFMSNPKPKKSSEIKNNFAPTSNPSASGTPVSSPPPEKKERKEGAGGGVRLRLILEGEEALLIPVDGRLVSGVHLSSRAFRQGLRPGMQIVQIGNTEVPKDANSAEIRRMIKAADSDSGVERDKRRRKGSTRKIPVYVQLPEQTDPVSAPPTALLKTSSGETSFGEITIQGAATELLRLCEATSVVEKLDGFSKCKAILTAALRSPAIFPVLEGDKGADAYMPLLSYAILRANPNNLLAHVQFVRLMHPDSLSVKDFVDACVAIKALYQLGSLSLSETVPPPPSSPQNTVAPEPPPEPEEVNKPKIEELKTPTAVHRRGSSPVMGIEEAELRGRLGEAMVSMGYPASSVEFAVDALSLADLADEAIAQGKLLGFLGDLQHVLEMGYPKHKAMLALIRYPNLREAVAYLIRNEGSNSNN